MALITNTAGGSGSTALNTLGPVTLFTTPDTLNAIFIVYVYKQNDSTGAVSLPTGVPNKLIVGPDTAVRWPSGSLETGRVVWNWVQMEIQ